MGRILAIDYGKVRTGLAHTDELQIIASALETVATKEIWNYLDTYFKTENVSDLVIGLPMRAHGEPGEIEADIQKFIQKFQKIYPKIPIHREDESYTSIKAAETLWMAGTKKKKRQEKGMLDKVSATIILQQFLERKN